MRRPRSTRTRSRGRPPSPRWPRPRPCMGRRNRCGSSSPSTAAAALSSTRGSRGAPAARARALPALVRDRLRGPAGGREADRGVLRGAGPRGTQRAVRTQDFAPGTPILIYLHTPRGKAFGVLLALQPAGIAVRGIDLNAFDDFVRQEARRETGLGLVTLFYPMSRVER